MATGVNELLPGDEYSKPVALTSAQVQLFKHGTKPKTGCILVARVAAHGNGYADMKTLEQTLREQAVTLKADVVLIDKFETTKDETVGAYWGRNNARGYNYAPPPVRNRIPIHQDRTRYYV